MKKQLVVDIIDSIAVSKNSAEVPMDNKRINDKQKMVFVFFLAIIKHKLSSST